MLIGVPLGVRAATRPNSPTDLGAMATAVFGLSIPDFALGLGLIVLFGVALHVSRLADTCHCRGARWPSSSTSSSRRSPSGSRRVRSSPGSRAAACSRRSPPTTSHGAPGLRRAGGGWLALPNTLIHVLTVVGSVAVILLGGAFVVKTVFNLPGLGNLVVMAVKRRDYPLVQGCLLLISTVVILVNLLVDVLYAYLDPQIRYG